MPAGNIPYWKIINVTLIAYSVECLYAWAYGLFLWILWHQEFKFSKLYACNTCNYRLIKLSIIVTYVEEYVMLNECESDLQHRSNVCKYVLM